MKDETIGNQQQTLSQAEIGWLAGIIEGEGSISMNVRKKHWNGWNGIGVDLSLQIVNTDAAIIEKSMSVLKKMGIEAHLFERNQVPLHHSNGKSYSSAKTILALSTHKMRNILTILGFISPHLAGEKKYRALLIVQFIERRLTRQGQQAKIQGKSWYDAYDWKTVKEFYSITGGKLLPEVQRMLNDYTPDTQNKCDDIVCSA